MGVIEEIKQKLDIVEVIGEYVTLTKAGRTFKGLCPLHSEKHPSFYVYPEQQSWHCFGACNTGGDIFSFIMKKQNLSFAEALRLLAEKAGVSLPQRGVRVEQKEKDRLYELNEAAALYFHRLLLDSQAAERARNYLISRGLKAKTVSTFKLGYSLNSWEALKQHFLERGYSEGELLKAGLILEAESGQTHDRFRNKLIFPIADFQGRIIGFGARVLDDSLPKYVNSPQTPLFDKSGAIYALDLARASIREQDLAIIVEGYMDAITAHQNGFTNVVASMGTSVTERQIGNLKKLTRNIALALDADAAGEEAMLRCVTLERSLGAEVKVIQMPKGKDPDDVIRESPQLWQELVLKAVPAVEYTFKMVTSRLNLEKASDKSQAADKLLPVIAQIEDVVRQAHYLEELARLLKVSPRSLELALGKLKSVEKSKAPKVLEASRLSKPLFSRPVEEYCLALLLKYPELKERAGEVRAEYFENSENREIFLALKEAEDVKSLKEKLDGAIWEQVDHLLAKELPSEQLQLKWEDCVLRLREEYLRNLKRKEVMALEGQAWEEGLPKQVVEISGELKDIFTQRRKRK